jgi:predicted ribosome quality control (RQC) complex YloA/Tae2 family protein
MNLSLIELEAVVEELERELLSGQIQEFRQPSRSSIWMAVRAPGKSLSVLLETARQRARVHLVEMRTSTLTPPPAFVSHLRAHLENARVIAVDMPWPDRVVVFRCQRGDVQLSLVLECSSHHPNLFITDWAGNIHLALQPSASKERSLLPGERYEPPLPSPGREVRREGGGAASMVNRVGDADSPSAVLAAHFATLDSDEAFQVQHRHRLQAVGRELRRARRALASVQRDLARASEWQSHQRRGELLKASYALLRPGMTSVDVVDYWDPGQRIVTMELDPAQSPQESVERSFKQARKGKRGAEIAAARQRELEARAGRLEELSEELQAVADMAALKLLDKRLLQVSPRLRRALEVVPVGGRRKAQAAPRLPYREYMAQTGRPIRVGRGDRDNHALTFQHAAPNDVWLHVRGFSGSHVVLPLARGQEPDGETLLDAAYLAIHYSRAPDEGFNEVMWTRRKHVRAVKQGAPGKVIVQQEKNLAVEVDLARLKALLSRRER